MLKLFLFAPLFFPLLELGILRRLVDDTRSL
jgi:hypothetical protein